MGWLFVHAKSALTRRAAGGLSPPIGQRVQNRWAAAAPWVGGMVLAVLILGPALRPGSLLNLDLVFTPRMPVPRGVWGLGPELSRRMPLGVFVAWASLVVGGPVVGKALLLVSISAAFVGVWRLAANTPFVCRLGAGVLYAASPFTLTRIGVGHWTLVAALGILPWAFPALLRPSDDLRRTWLWSVALGLTGITGGMYAAVLLAAGLTAERGRRAPSVIAVFAVAQLPWLVPGLFSVASVGHLANGRHFATRADLPLGLLRLVVGSGFWRAPSQVGGADAGRAILGLGLVSLAAYGAASLPREWRWRALGAAGVSLFLAAASGLPGFRVVYTALTDTAYGAAFRDGQRLLAPFLVWAAVAAAYGAVRLAAVSARWLEPTIQAIPAVVGIVLAAPGLWGVNGALEPAKFPSSWADARAEVQQHPGTVLALPWHEYLNLGFADGRRVLNPVPDYFGGDVLASSDPELGDRRTVQEQGDPRERHVLPALDDPAHASDALAKIGVRWVVLLNEVKKDEAKYAGLFDDRGLRQVVRSIPLVLFEVRSWRGPVVDHRGNRLPLRNPVQPVADIPPSGRATWARPGLDGWLRGTSSATVTRDGLLGLPPGRGLVWYWPAAVTIAGDLVVILGVCGAVWVGRRRPKRETNQESAAQFSAPSLP